MVDPSAAYERQRFEARRPIAPRRTGAALAPNQANLRSGGSETSLLSLDGVPDRPDAGQYVTNLQLDPSSRSAAADTRIDWHELGEEEPDAGLGNGAWDVWRPASLIPSRRCSSPAWVTAFTTNTASSDRRSGTAVKSSFPTTGCDVPTRGRSPASTRRLKSRCTARFSFVGVSGRPSPNFQRLSPHPF